ncbi:MAG: hypothetical protein C0514_02460 [Candidatus Puniceispirillum sp.]|nr:hypothetical protein [Candidatus Puniceispirillum sp.]
MQNKFMKAVLVATALVSGNLFATAHDQDLADLWNGTKTAYALDPGAAQQILTDITGAEEYTDGVQDAYAALLRKVQAPLEVTVDRTGGAGVVNVFDNADPLAPPVAKTVLSLNVAGHLVPNVKATEPDVDMTDEINKVVLGLFVENVRAEDRITSLTAELAARPTQEALDDMTAERDARIDPTSAAYQLLLARPTQQALDDMTAERDARPTQRALDDMTAERDARPTQQALDDMTAERDARPTQQALDDMTAERDARPTQRALDDMTAERDDAARQLGRLQAAHVKQSDEVRLILDAVNVLRNAAGHADYASSTELAADLPNLLATLARPVVTTTTRTTTTASASSSSSSAPAIALPSELLAASPEKQDAYRNWQALVSSGAPRRAVLTAKAAFDSIAS